MNTDLSLNDEFECFGRVWLRNAITEADLIGFDNAVTLQAKAGQRIDHNQVLTNTLSADGSLRKAISEIDPAAKPVRIVAFNKSDGANWGVPWHQDRVIAAAEKHTVYGFQNWTNKAQTWHCEPPQELLERMLFVRVHLDDTNEANGAMQIAVGSHVKGIVPAGDAEKTARQYPIEICEAARGDVLILKMLTLHSSKPSLTQSDRRVFRIDFASFDLPAPLMWT